MQTNKDRMGLLVVREVSLRYSALEVELLAGQEVLAVHWVGLEELGPELVELAVPWVGFWGVLVPEIKLLPRGKWREVFWHLEIV
jgi:hypothetical protein